MRVSTTDGGESGATGLDWLLVVSNQGELVGGVECSDGDLKLRMQVLWISDIMALLAHGQTEGIPLIQHLKD